MEDIRKEQDSHLLELESVLGRIGDKSKAIASELDGHVEILEDLDDDVDRVQDSMDFVRGRMKKLLQTDNNCHLTTIFVLSGIVIFLALLLIFG